MGRLLCVVVVCIQQSPVFCVEAHRALSSYFMLKVFSLISYVVFLVTCTKEYLYEHTSLYLSIKIIFSLSLCLDF